MPPPSAASQIETYCGGEGTAAHYHPLLVINVDGSQKPLPYDPSQPADIGYINSPGYTNSSLYCSNGGLHALHTHDGSGIIHLELPSSLAGITPTLGEFFTIWGEPLSSQQVWSYSGTVHATVRNVETGIVTDYSSDPARIPLTAASCGPTCNPAPIPESLIFNGAHGNGQSGGQFSGEIIWLNVTTAPQGASSGAMVAGELGCVCMEAALCTAPDRASGWGTPWLPMPSDVGQHSGGLGVEIAAGSSRSAPGSNP